MTATDLVVDAASVPGAREALRALAGRGRRGRRPALVRDGESLYAIVEITPASWPIDEEMVALSLSPRFRELIAHARRQAEQGQGMPADAFQHELGITDEEIAAVKGRRVRRRHAPSTDKG